MQYIRALKYSGKTMIISSVSVVFAVLVNYLSKQPVPDPLLLALIIGIFCRSIFKFEEKFLVGCKSSAMFFISIGVIFYGFTNLNFRTFSQVNTDYIFLLLLVLLTYLISILLLSHWLGSKEKTGYIYPGICGLFWWQELCLLFYP